MRAGGQGLIRLIAILALVATALLRPPGMMVGRDGESVTYVICSAAGGTRSISVPAGDGEHEADPACAFFAAQIAAPAPDAPEAASRRLAHLRIAPTPASAQAALRPPHRPHAPRAPPSES